MTRICILGDTHWGCRNDLPLFYKHFDKFYTELINYCLQQGITEIFQLGDLFDRRKYINFRTLSESKSIFFDKLKHHNITMLVLVGNHDIHMRESVDINSPSLVLGEYDNIKVYSEPTTVQVDNTSIDIIPWICRDNQAEVMEFMKASKSDLCFGHFEIATFSMYRGVESHDGLPIDMFGKYEMVCSGHYHTRSKKENIVYVGTPYEMTWQDFNDPKGFHTFDTETRKLKFFENPDRVFVRIDYDDSQPMQPLDDIDLTDCFVKVVVTNKTDLYKFDQYIQNLYTKGCYEIKIVEDMTEFADGEIGEEIDLEDTMDVLSNYIDSIDTDADKDKIKQFIKTLYVEAIHVEVI
jgi:DNA repair exonuclease SbcCD nuclease subunit